MLIAAALMIGVIWAFSSAEREYALNQYLEVNQNSANTIQYEVQDNIASYTDSEHHVDYIGLLGSLSKFDFSSTTILNKNGTVLASTDEKIKDAYINTLGEGGKTAFFSEDGGNIIINGDAYYFAKVISDDYRLMCVTNSDKLLSEKTKISALIFVEVLIILLIISILVTLIIVLHKQKYDVLYRVKPVNNYTLTTNKIGKILASDTNFKNTFGKVNFSESFLNKDTSLREELTSGHMLLFGLKNNKNEVRKVAFNATSGLGEYKLVGSDVTEFMNRHEELLKNYETDPLTGLGNMQPFKRDWDEFVEKEDFKEGLMCFFGVPNIEYYRTLYGELSFAKGFKFVTNRISNILSDYGKMYAVNGNIFLLIRKKELRQKFINNIKQIQEKLSETISIYNNLIKLDIRLGVILLTSLKQDTNLDFVFNAGTRALKFAKEIEDVPFYIQRAVNFDTANYQLVTHEMINEFIVKGGVDVHFQPQVEIATEKVVGFEALFRLTDPRIKDMSVFEFIAEAEKQGCIVELGEFIYQRALDFAQLMQKFDLTVSINISPIQLMQMGFVERFLREYKKRNIKPGIVHVEIVESTMIYSINDVIQKLELLKENGVYAEIDDFGIAYSSMLYLKKLPITTIKIDKAFVDNIENSKKDKDLIKNMINITKDFNLLCVAEGVERKGQKQILEELGCDIIQGYYYSPAIPKDKVFDYIKKMNKLKM